MISSNGEPQKQFAPKEPALRTLAMPADANVNGDIFGGWVLSQMDLAGGIVAKQKAGGRVATVAVDAMKFIRPVHIGDVLCVYAQIEHIGRSSIAVRIECYVLRGHINSKEKVTEALYTYVALGPDSRPKDISQLNCRT